MKYNYIRSGYYKFRIFTLTIAMAITLLGCGSNKSVNNDNSVASNKYSGSVALSWYAPTKNEDGSHLTDLSGYKIYYGTTSRNYTQYVDTGNVTAVNIGNLAPGTYYFALVAYDNAGNESDYSREITRYIEES